MQLQRGSEGLRSIKDQNQQARQKLASTCGSISQLYGFVEQATEATAAQLESTHMALQQHAAKQPATAEPPLEPGPGQVSGLCFFTVWGSYRPPFVEPSAICRDQARWRLAPLLTVW